jgi:hypothetical protein
MHEVDLGHRQQLMHERDLGDGGAIKMPDAAGPQCPQDARLGIALDGIKDIAWEALDKPTRCGHDRRRPQAQQRVGRPYPGNDGIDRRENGTPERAGRDKTGLRHRTILQIQEATQRSLCQRRRRRSARFG